MGLGRGITAALTASVLAIAIGCGGDQKTGEVSGTVKYAGETVGEGSVTFFPADGKGSTAGGPIKDGKYSVRGVATGSNKVSITGSKFVKMKAVYPGEKNSPQMPVHENPLPAKYGDQTELTFDVKPGMNEKHFDLPK